MATFDQTSLDNVRFYTDKDPYYYTIDNRPLRDLDGNVRKVADQMSSISDQAADAVAKSTSAVEQVTILADQIGGLSDQTTEALGQVSEALVQVNGAVSQVEGVTGQLTVVENNLSSVTGRVTALEEDVVTIEGQLSDVPNQFKDKLGASRIGWDLGITGAAYRTVASKLSDQINVKDFGAIGDGTYHPVSEWYTVGFSAYRGYANLAAVQVDYPHVTSATQSIDWAALQASANSGASFVRAPKGVYAVNEHLNVPDGVSITGDGCDAWDIKGSWRPRRMVEGTTILILGTPTITKTVVNVSNMKVAGGVVANDFSEGFAGNANYSLLDFTMGDATGATPATPKPLKVGVGLGSNSFLKNLRVQLNYLGVAGYNSANVLPDFEEFTQDRLGLGDNWDIGVLTYNRMHSGVDHCQVVGYWRMAGRAVISSNYGDGKSYSGAVFYDNNVFYQGMVGIAIRGNDVHRITALTSTTLEIPWNESHTVPTSGSCYIAGTARTYTTSTKVGDKLVLSGFSINPSSFGTVGTECYFGTNPGFAGSSVSDGFITGLGHYSNYRPYDTALETPTAYPSKAHEISGSPLRDILFKNIHFFDTDCIGFLHDALHISYVGCYAEAQGFSGGAPGSVKGARYIASCRIELPDANGLYPAGNCAGLYWDKSSQMSDGSVDMYPVYRNASGRFTGTTKYFMPDSFLLECTGYWAEQWDTVRRYDIGSRVYVNGPVGGEKYFEVVDSSLTRYLRINANTQRIGLLTSSPGTSIDFAGSTEASMRMRTSVEGSDPQYTLTNTIGSWTARPQASSANQYQLRYNNVSVFQVGTTGTVFSVNDNTADLGTTSARYKTAYFGTAIGSTSFKVPNGYFNNLFTDSGTVAVSDETLKQDIENIPDNVLDAWAMVEYKQYRLKERVDAIGSSARTHFGVMAQRVEKAFVDNGVDPFKYGILCIESWEDQYEPVMDTRTIVVEETVGEGDESHTVSRTEEEIYATGEMRLVQAAGSHYGVRYEEALVLEAALARRNNIRQAEIISALEQRLSLLENA